MKERHSTAQPFYSKNSNRGKQLYSALIRLLHLIMSDKLLVCRVVPKDPIDIHRTNLTERQGGAFARA